MKIKSIDSHYDRLFIFLLSQFSTSVKNSGEDPVRRFGGREKKTLVRHESHSILQEISQEQYDETKH